MSIGNVVSWCSVVRCGISTSTSGYCRRTHVGLPVRYWRKVGMTSSPHGTYGLGHTRATYGNDNGKQGCKAEQIRKDCLSSNYSMQLGNMKLKLLVIADQHAVVNMYRGLVHTAHHTLGIGFTRSIEPTVTHDFYVPLTEEYPP